MCSLLYKEEDAHEKSICSCDWGRFSPETKMNNQDNNDKSQNSTMSAKAHPGYIVTGGEDNLVKIWKLQKGNLVLKYRFKQHSQAVTSVALSKNGKLCASCSWDSTMNIWNLENGEHIAQINVKPEKLRTLVFGPDDKLIITGSHTGMIIFHNVETGVAEKIFDGNKCIMSLTYSSDCKYIAIRTFDCSAYILDNAENKSWHSLDDSVSVRSLCFSPDSQLLLTGSADCSIRLYDVKHLNVVVTLSGHYYLVSTVAFSPNGKYFASGSLDNTVKIWELAYKRCVHTFKHHIGQVSDVKFSPDNSKIMSVSKDKSINIYTCPM